VALIAEINAASQNNPEKEKILAMTKDANEKKAELQTLHTEY